MEHFGPIFDWTADEIATVVAASAPKASRKRCRGGNGRGPNKRRRVSAPNPPRHRKVRTSEAVRRQPKKRRVDPTAPTPESAPPPAPPAPEPLPTAPTPELELAPVPAPPSPEPLPKAPTPEPAPVPSEPLQLSERVLAKLERKLRMPGNNGNGARIYDGWVSSVGCIEGEYTRFQSRPRKKFIAWVQTPDGKHSAVGWTKTAECEASLRGVPNCSVALCTHDDEFCGARFLVIGRLLDVCIKHAVALNVAAALPSVDGAVPI